MRVQARHTRLLACVLAASLAAAPGWAEKPDHAGGPKHKARSAGQGHQAKAARDDRADPNVRLGAVGQGERVGRQPLKPGAYIGARHRDAVRSYYAQHYADGKRCPPGLAKKNNGCLPPGQAKKWRIGERLPAGVAVQPVPQAVLVHLPKVPPGHRYVTVAGDILLIAVGSKMVVDGITGLLGG